jgi:hypothetical protein
MAARPVISVLASITVAVGLAMPMVAAADVWVGKPTIGDYVRRDFKDLLQAQQAAVGEKAKFNIEIAEARKAFLATASTPAKRAQAGQRFGELLFAKDLLYGVGLMQEGVSDAAWNRINGLHAISGGPLDNGIMPDALPLYHQWINAVRTALGARSRTQYILITNPDRLREALDASSAQYRIYTDKRDALEISKPADDARRAAEAEALRKKITAATAADGGSAINSQSTQRLGDGIHWHGDRDTPPLRRMLFQARDAGQQVLQCRYGPSLNSRGEESYAQYTFWFESQPANIRQMVAMDSGGALQFLGSEALANCPPSDKAALAFRQRMSGYPTVEGRATPVAGQPPPRARTRQEMRRQP